MEFSRELLITHPVSAAQILLGAYIHYAQVVLQITEVEAYGTSEQGPWPDPASHCYPGPTPRNATMYGPAGHLYTYLSYGIHICGNISCGPEGIGCGVLLRAARIVSGEQIVRQRRADGNGKGTRVAANDPVHKLASGPGRVGQCLALSLADNGQDMTSNIELHPTQNFHCGPRIGISKNKDAPWRLWIPGEPSVTRARRTTGNNCECHEQQGSTASAPKQEGSTAGCCEQQRATGINSECTESIGKSFGNQPQAMKNSS